jgi:hypothetical protein
MNHSDHFDKVQSDLKDLDKRDYESIDGVVAENEPGDLKKKADVVSYFSKEIVDKEDTTLVDVGCFSGKNFTADFARQNPKIEVVGLDIFSPEAFNKDSTIPRDDFNSPEEVMIYLRELYKDMENLFFYWVHVDENTAIEPFYSNGQRILTGFKTPGKLGVDLILQAEENDVDLLINTPSNLPEMGEKDYPISEHAKSKGMPRNDLLKLLKLEYRMKREGNLFVPKEKQDKLNYSKSKLAKLIVCLDRARYLQERGMQPFVTRYNDSFGWGNHTPEHLIYASRK